MKLPSMKYSSGIKKTTQVKFGGLERSLGAGEGSLWDMRNLTGDHFSLLSARAPRYLAGAGDFGGIYGWKKLCRVEGTDFYYGDKVVGQVTEGPKTFVGLGSWVAVFPDKWCYNQAKDEFLPMDSEWTGESLTFESGTLYGAPAVANCIRCEGVNWEEYFQTGDAVDLTGCTVHPENNKSLIIREMNGDKLYFYDNTLTLDGEDGVTPYTENGALTISRKVPELAFVFEHDNRLWGCSEDTVFASKQGDIFNWSVSDGLASDSWNVPTISTGEFTGACSYAGYPTFFKEDRLYKVYGETPSNYELLDSGVTHGVARGSGGSLAIAGETLFYLSPSGVMAYSGGIPQSIGEAFGTERFRNGIAGSDGLKYYISMEGADGWGLYVYDTRLGLWFREDNTHATHFARQDGNLWLLNDRGELWIVSAGHVLPEGVTEETGMEWLAEFGDFTEQNPNRKGVDHCQLRLELDAGATAQVWMMFDSSGKWERVWKELGESVKKSYYLPIIPRRCDHYRLKITGTGGCRIYSLAREFYISTER